MISETRKRGNRFMFIGIVIAIIAVIAMMQVISGIQASAQGSPTPTPDPVYALVYAVQDIPNQTSIRTILEEEMATTLEEAEAETPDVCPADIRTSSVPIGALQICLIPQRFAPESAVVLPDIQVTDPLTDVEELRSIIDREIGHEFTQKEIRRGTPLLTELLEQIIIEPGMVEVPIGVNSITSVGGRVRPGQRVDVVVSYDESGSTEFLFQNVEVIAVDTVGQRLERLGAFEDNDSGAAYAVYEDMTGGSRSNDTAVIVAMTPEDALMLVNRSIYARELRLLIRHPGDDVIRDTAVVSLPTTPMPSFNPALLVPTPSLVVPTIEPLPPTPTPGT